MNPNTRSDGALIFLAAEEGKKRDAIEWTFLKRVKA
jgi:hypothetical protein|tara:strand:- start:412 stop:519 length:108 start_codon:yes stop_codon:yes gene_type:complete